MLDLMGTTFAYDNAEQDLADIDFGDIREIIIYELRLLSDPSMEWFTKISPDLREDIRIAIICGLRRLYQGCEIRIKPEDFHDYGYFWDQFFLDFHPPFTFF
jgi:hypothetical protein